jgi:CRP-like cAMP-binding protein
VVAFQGPSNTSSNMTSPLFSFLDSAEFANLVHLLELKRVAPGTTIMREGDKGDGFCIIARGRVLVYCYNFHGDKVYLSSLSDGDCFGEFSFFTGEPRAATVEALEEVLWSSRSSHRDFDTILDRFPNLTNALLRSSTRTRVVSTLLAKSEVFGGAAARATRRAGWLDRLVSSSTGPPRSDVILKRRRRRATGFYLIKSGEVEVYSEKHLGLRVLEQAEERRVLRRDRRGHRSAAQRLGARPREPCELLQASRRPTWASSSPRTPR